MSETGSDGSVSERECTAREVSAQIRLANEQLDYWNDKVQKLMITLAGIEQRRYSKPRKGVKDAGAD